MGRPLWVVRTVAEHWDDITNANADAARPQARKKLDRRREELEEFQWEGALVDSLRLGHQVLQILADGPKKRAFAPAHVVAKKVFRRPRRKTSEMVVSWPSARVPARWTRSACENS